MITVHPSGPVLAGRCGECYGVNTLYKNRGDTLFEICRFLRFAHLHPELQFQVSALGNAAIRSSELLPLFDPPLANVRLMTGWGL